MKLLQIHEFDAVFALMEQSFPNDEYRPYHEQKALLKVPKYRIYVHKESEQICAFAAVWVLEGFSFVEHFAVSPKYRNCGLGSEMLKELITTLGDPICLEVELPETELSARRIGFYERNGFFFNDYPYIQPAISKGKQPIPLRIMTTGRKIDVAEYERIKAELYTNVYQIG